MITRKPSKKPFDLFDSFYQGNSLSCSRRSKHQVRSRAWRPRQNLLNCLLLFTVQSTIVERSDLAVNLSSLNETLLLREKNLSHFLPGHWGNPLTCAVFHFHCEPIISELDVELLPSHVWYSVENTHTYTPLQFKHGYTWLEARWSTWSNVKSRSWWQNEAKMKPLFTYRNSITYSFISNPSFTFSNWTLCTIPS